MKTIIAITVATLLVALSWIWLGWLAFIILPVSFLFVLMACAPLLISWEQHDASSHQPRETPFLPELRAVPKHSSLRYTSSQVNFSE